MKFNSPLLKGTLIKRYKRFLADIKLEDGSIITAHCPNSGSMMGFKEPNTIVYVSKINSQTAKLKYKWELAKITYHENNAIIGVNTHNTNLIAKEALEKQQIKELNHFSIIKSESTYTKNCRFDFLLTNNNTSIKAFVEVKNVTLSRNNGIAEFPDAKTERGVKHLEHLVKAAKEGYEAYMLYIIQRNDCTNFKIAEDIDQEYKKALLNAINNNVKILCYTCNINEFEITINNTCNILI